jgi:hypothetical protein
LFARLVPPDALVDALQKTESVAGQERRVA